MEYQIFSKTVPYKFLWWSGEKTYFYVTRIVNVQIQNLKMSNKEIYSRDYHGIAGFLPFSYGKYNPYKFWTFEKAYMFIESQKNNDRIENDKGLLVYTDDSKF